MPKSRRDRKITLAQTKKKVGLESKQQLVEQIRESVDQYQRCFVFTLTNERNLHLKAVREQWKGRAKFFLGKNRVMALALGKTPEDEYGQNLSRVSGLLRRQCGLLFTDQDKSEVCDYFGEHAAPDFARTGTRATDRVTLAAGPLEQFPHSMETQLRALGLPTALKRGVVTLLQDYTVCEQGDALSSEQARLLKLLGHQQAKFSLNMIALWNKKDGEFELLKENTGGDEENEGEEGEGEMSD